MVKSNPRTYEINAVEWLHQLSRESGKPLRLGQVPEAEWDSLQELGFSYVWLMGVWKRSPLARKIAQESTELYSSFEAALPDWKAADVIGSAYSIQSYRPDKRVGGWEDLELAKQALNRRGMRLILDFVPNHTAPDHFWVKKHPDYYLQGELADYQQDPNAFFPIHHLGETIYIAKGRDPFFLPWQDTLQLDYSNLKTRVAMIRQLKKIRRYCDGVRCDMAMLVLNQIFAKTWEWLLKREQPLQEFWAEAISAIPNFVWIAEAYWDTEWTLQQMGFHYVYDKKLYDLLRWSSAPDIRVYLQADINFQTRLTRFIENHDEPRSAKVFVREKLLVAAVLLSTLPGMRLFQRGQLEGKKVRIPVHLINAGDEEANLEVKAMYKKLLSITTQESFHSGAWKLKNVLSAGDDSFPNLIAYRWQLNGELKLIVVNLSPNWSQGRVHLGDDVKPEKYRLYDELNEHTYLRNGKAMADDGLHVILEGFSAHIFDFCLL